MAEHSYSNLKDCPACDERRRAFLQLHWVGLGCSASPVDPSWDHQEAISLSWQCKEYAEKIAWQAQQVMFDERLTSLDKRAKLATLQLKLQGISDDLDPNR